MVEAFPCYCHVEHGIDTIVDVAEIVEEALEEYSNSKRSRILYGPLYKV